jgi:hypothetical protein
MTDEDYKQVPSNVLTVDGEMAFGVVKYRIINTFTNLIPTSFLGVRSNNK